MATTLTSVRAIEDELAALRIDAETGAVFQRTSVLTHIAWVPEEWVAAAEDVLAGLAERHPSRTIVLVPEPDAADGLDGAAEIECYPVGDGRAVCVETIRIRLRGRRAQAHLLAGWLRSRLDREVELEHDPSDRLVGVEIDGKPAPFPPGDPPPPAELLSDELDRFGRDRIYEAAVRSASQAG